MTTRPTNITTLDPDTNSSDDGTMSSPLSSPSTDRYSTATDDELASGDDEVMASSLFLDSSKKGDMGSDDDDGEIDDEVMSSTEVECQKEQPEVNAMEHNSRCQFMNKCNTDSTDYRKVVSHFFGRNKKCTTQIPEECWIEYCRKHYQRTKYRTTKDERKNWVGVQLDILCRQLTRLERWGEVRSWEIAIRKKERDVLKKEDDRMVQIRSSGGTVNQATSNQVHICRERRFLGHCGPNKAYDDVRTLIDFVKREVRRGIFDDMPGLEFLPDIDPIAYPPRGASKALKDEDGCKASPAITTPLKKTQLGKASSSTPSRVWKPTTRKEKAKRTRRLTRASERYMKLEPETDSSPVPASSTSTTPHRLEATTASLRNAVYPLAKDSSASPAIASSSQTAAFSARTAVMTPRRRGVADPRQPVPMTPSPPPTTTSAASVAASSSSSFPGFHPVNVPYGGIAYRPATPKTPPCNITPSPQVSRRPSSSHIDSTRNVVFSYNTNLVPSKVEMDD